MSTRLRIHWINKTIQMTLKCYILCYFVFPDTSTLSLSDNLPAIVGGTVCASATVVIGIVLALFVIRYAIIYKSCSEPKFIFFK